MALALFSMALPAHSADHPSKLSAVCLPGDNCDGTSKRAQFFAAGSIDLLTESFLDDLQKIRDGDGSLSDYDEFSEALIRDLIYWFAVPAYNPSLATLARFFPFHPQIANLAALSVHKTTDAAVASIVRTCDTQRLADALALEPEDYSIPAGCSQLGKAMVLHSARNTVRLHPRVLFAWNPGFASLWYVTFFWLGYGAMPNPNALSNMKQHMSATDTPRSLLIDGSSSFGLDCLLNTYYMCTYIDPRREQNMRQLVNLWATSDQGVVGQLHRLNTYTAPDSLVDCYSCKIKKRILVIDAFWIHTYSSHRVIFRMVRKLQDQFHIDLLRASTNRVSMTQGFQSVYDMPRRADGSVLFLETMKWIVQSNYSAILYPSISMDRVTLWLSHFRLAPIQVASYGQPVSTHGAMIDYWLAGEAVGLNHYKDFSERHLLLPGMGILHSYPTHYELSAIKNISRTVGSQWLCTQTISNLDTDPDSIIVNAQAAVHKTNADWLQLIANMVAQVSRPLTLRFFPNLRVHDNFTIAVFTRDVENVFQAVAGYGDTLKIQIVCTPSPKAFMQVLAAGDLYLDSVPFGGCSSIVDVLLVNQPLVSLSGTKYSNRCGPHLLESAGLHEMVAYTERDYFATAVRLMTDTSFRNTLRSKMKRTDWHTQIFSTNVDRESDYIAAFNFLFENHDQLKLSDAKTPVRVDTLCDSGAYLSPCH